MWSYYGTNHEVIWSNVPTAFDHEQLNFFE